MAQNPTPTNYASLMVLSKEAFDGASAVGGGIPLLINTASTIGTDRDALKVTQASYKAAKAALGPLSETRKAAIQDAYNFCLTARDVLRFFCGREFNQAWLAAGFTNSLKIPQGFTELHTLTETLVGYFVANPNHENEALQVTAAQAQMKLDNLNNSNGEWISQRADVTSLLQVRDLKKRTLRARLGGLCKELSQRLGPMDARWRDFGFNMPGSPSVPRVPQNVVVTSISGARFQVACDPSPNATHYRFFYQRPIEDPEPIFGGNANDPLFVTGALEAGQTYLVYVSAVNSGAESELSEPVNGMAVQAEAA